MAAPPAAMAGAGRTRARSASTAATSVRLPRGVAVQLRERQLGDGGRRVLVGHGDLVLLPEAADLPLRRPHDVEQQRRHG